MLTDDHPALARAVSWNTGLDHLLERLVAHLAGHQRVVIAVTGGVGSGKTTLAHALAKAATSTGHGAVMLSTDHYLPDYTPELPVLERDLPEHADLDLLGRQLLDLVDGRPIERPVWSFLTHRREGTERIESPGRGLIVVEGIHAMVDEVVGLAHDSAYVHTPATIRRERFIARDREGERGMGVDESARFFDEVADPTFLGLAPGYIHCAGIVLRGDSMSPGGPSVEKSAS